MIVGHFFGTSIARPICVHPVYGALCHFFESIDRIRVNTQEPRMAKVNPAIDKAVSYFSEIPWCSALINAPDTKIFRHLPRGPRDNARDKFSVETLGGPANNCILHHVSFYKTPRRMADDPPYEPYTSNAEVPEVTTLYAVGDGATGWPGIAHGGLQAYMIDETAVALMAISMNSWDAYSYETHEVKGLTTDLSVRFRSACKIPGILRCHARYKATKGNRIFVSVTIQNEDGTVAATGEITWINMLNPQGKL